MRSELYTARKLLVIKIICGILFCGVLATSMLMGFLPKLLEIQEVQVMDPQAQQMLQMLDPKLEIFQLQMLDITGSSQSGGLVISQIAAVVLGVTLVAGNFRHGAVIWKVLQGRLRWGLNILGATALCTASIAALSCFGTLGITGVVTSLYGVDWNVQVGELLLVWVRGILSLTLLALACAGVTLATRSGGLAAAVIGGVLGAETIIGTIMTLAHYDAKYLSWMPSHAIAAAVGVGNDLSYGIGAGLLCCIGWALVACLVGCLRLRTYNL